jgi:hypothetical protein
MIETGGLLIVSIWVEHLKTIPRALAGGYMYAMYDISKAFCAYIDDSLEVHQRC